MKPTPPTYRIIRRCLILLVVVTLTIVTIFTVSNKLATPHTAKIKNAATSKKVAHPIKHAIGPTAALYHTFAGFSIDTPDRAIDAASDGLQFTFDYGNPPSPTSSVGKQLQALHMKVIDGFIASNLYYYECHKSKTIPNPSPTIANYCGLDRYPSYTSDDAVLAAIKAHLQSVQLNPLVAGYWVLDDQASWDVAGYAKNILEKAHALIQQYTPNRPTICGFGASLGVGKKFDWWQSTLALNFTPRGCDMVGLYIYADSQPLNHPVSSNTFDWTMSNILPQVFSSLRAHGWNITTEPLVGITQAWAGPRTDYTTLYVPLPSAQNMQTQALSFCQHGAIALTYYAWDDSEVHSFPWNTPTMKQGIQQGNTACNLYWNNKP